MIKTAGFFNSTFKTNLILFVCSLAIYSFYFGHIFLNLNSILSSITLDSLKNYYTFAFHVKNDPELLKFSGMNYPFGEHIIYTDCQPVITFILRLLPFTHPYLIGIMHGLMFFSFIITPVILNKILVRFDLNRSFSFFASLAIALLSPQFLKINGGHFALAYGCLIPISILLIQSCLKEKSLKNLLYLFLYNTFLFLLHPYTGFCLSIFSFLALFFFEIAASAADKKNFFKNALLAAVTGIVPLVLFRVFMRLTDHHENRTTEPYGADVMLENADSMLAPGFGPFKKLMGSLFPNPTFHFEGHTYLGFFTILVLLLLIVTLPFTFKKIRFRKDVAMIFLASVVFLLIAFGFHLKVLHFFNLYSPSVNQFRAVCRFAWIFYFTLPLFLLVTVHDLLHKYFKPERINTALLSVSLVFFLFNLVEANYFFTGDTSAFWKYSNFFREDLLNAEEKKNIALLKQKPVQAILPLPVFYGGSEMYDRLGSNNSMIPSVIYSYHSNTPILSGLLSRTSITETEDALQLLNAYQKEKRILPLLNNKDLFVITTRDPLLPDEARLLKKVRQFGRNDSLQFGYLSVKDMLRPQISSNRSVIDNQVATNPSDSSDIVYLPYESRKPFLKANMKDYEMIYTLDSNKLKTGTYIVSFHYYYTEKVYRSLAADLIITRANAKGLDWQYNIPIRYLSGFYKGYGVFEHRIELDRKNKYEFIIKGQIDQFYSVSDFMLRPEDEDVLMTPQNQDTIVNNFPYY